ncbi:hypothetical protein E4U58_004379 [Claviceps cyperi]|nr:hypothetical protein E4U58_004379 [Claviceps cyperi]
MAIQTTPRYFGLPVQRFETLSPLVPDGVSAIRKRLEGVSYLIVHEKSTISLLSLPGLTDVLEKPIRSRTTSALPGSVSLLPAIFTNILPFAERPSSKPGSPRAKTTIGMAAIRMRVAIAFRWVLEDMREGNPDLTDFRTFEPRLLSTLERRDIFEEQAVYLFATGRASTT